MKKLFVLIAIALVSLLLANPVAAQETGDYASILAKSKAVDVPPGIYAHIAEQADAWFSQVPFAPTIFADDLAVALQSSTPPFVVDVRDNATYQKGHVPGSINIPLAVLFKPGNLAMLPDDGTKIVLVCVTGHTASMGAAALGVLGYNVGVLRFGYMGWNTMTKMKVWSNTAETPQTILGYNSIFAVGSKVIACGPLPYGVCQ